MHLVNSFGRVVEVTDPELIEKYLVGSMREATPEEVKEQADRRARAAAEAAEASDSGFYYQTVARTPDGFGMSRDILKKEMFNNGIYLSEHFSGQKVGLLYHSPYGLKTMRTDIRIAYTMFESDKIPEEWGEYLALADQVLVPSKWCQEIFAKAGVTADVVPLGYNDEAFTYIDRPVPVEEDGIFTFIHYDSFNIRKGFMEIFEAFNEEFGLNEPVRLILKTVYHSSPIPIMKSQYPNIDVIREEMSEDDLFHLLGRANCMVYPSRGEGFGITPLEAMATGIPAIVPNAHGISEYFNPDVMLEVKATELSPALNNRYKGQDIGHMVSPDVKHLREQMRYAYNHQAEMKVMGKAASEYVKNFTYKKTALRLGEILKSWENKPVAKRPESKYLPVEEV